jgi:integrase
MDHDTRSRVVPLFRPVPTVPAHGVSGDVPDREERSDKARAESAVLVPDSPPTRRGDSPADDDTRHGCWQLTGSPADVAVALSGIQVVLLSRGLALPLEAALRGFCVGATDAAWRTGEWSLDHKSPEAREASKRVVVRDAVHGGSISLDRFATCFARELDARAFNGPQVEAPSTQFTTQQVLGDYVKARKARGRADATLRFYENHKKTLLRLLPKYVREIEHARLLGYIETRRAEGAGEVVRKELHSVLRPAWKLAYKNGLVDVPAEKVIPDLDSMSKPRERWLPPNEVWAIVKWLAARSTAGRDHAANVAWAVACGAEAGAYGRARRADVRKDHRGSHVRGTKRKTRDRFAPSPLHEQQALLQYALANAGGTGGALFRRWTVTNANADLKEACTALGLAPCSTNDLRRSYATWLGQHGVRDELIEKAMGHKGATVLGRHYRKLTDDDLMRLMEEDVASEARARGALDGTPPVTQAPPVQPAGEPPSALKGATEPADRATDGPIAQSVELRTFNP